MGVDIYMKWEGFGKRDKTNPNYKNQITGFTQAGKHGYLRGAYFGGLSDVLRFLFNWCDWEQKKIPFNADAFEAQLKKLKASKGERPEKDRWNHTEGSNWDCSERQHEPVDKKTMKHFENFLKLGRKLIKEGKKPFVTISY